ncbi:MAG: hypothetical protein H6853_06625 [Rhodospirillales bacterium]|nr:hypothetical protein [Alphaproteobacteria bacterium]USO03202.1 MAG: hypothetical protein H6853_06625 [Rhodospirillales bacterium]
MKKLLLLVTALLLTAGFTPQAAHACPCKDKGAQTCPYAKEGKVCPCPECKDVKGKICKKGCKEKCCAEKAGKKGICQKGLKKNLSHANSARYND